MSETPEVSDEALFAAWRAGDEEAFERLFRRFQAPLARHLTRMLNDPAAAEDLVLETFLRFHRHRDRVRPGQPLKPLVWTIARNLARNRLRAERLWGWLPLAGAAERQLELERPASALEGEEIQRRVAAAFAALPRVQREACSLRLVGDLTLEEIAAVTGSSVGTVKSRLFYGLRRLRADLADLAPGKE